MEEEMTSRTMRKTSRLLAGIAAAAMMVAAAMVPASAAVATAPTTVAIYGTFDYCLNHNVSAVPCSTTPDRWLFTSANPARNSWRIVATRGSWSTCIEQQAGTNHLRLATCAWNTGQLWIPVLTDSGWNLLVNDGTGQCIEMNHTSGVPNGVVTATGCRDYPPQRWAWSPR
jgi:hypothetical protein